LSSSRTFRANWSALKGAIKCEALRDDSKPYSLASLRSDFCRILSFSPQRNGLLQSALCLQKLFAGKTGCTGAPCQPNSCESLLHFTVHFAFGFLHIVQAGSVEVVDSLNKRQIDLSTRSGCFIRQHDKCTRSANEIMWFRTDQDRKL